ncbi:UvrB/UvrC motif-containing protein [Clostridiaceae bacterium UIB06]|uniref:UvrB/UvrC motif-containing protein n=1 Tax=Clostridium thailandense TaxID=2794346 RepID=A0A949X619_9CLOT|nr:UvrB/UvrC motif-containing protein [Clostridium thailandense]MBV7276588.1 UvrB/UvrC motif-containing protein [Clostridium thailandense]MCH5136123.1 UvrB/UvrC motif-containing protein [Clostridiaceae bacterium UIB06]
MNLKEKIKELPSSPGVYLMKDSLNIIIYVGKSKNLKNRVGSYFHNSKSHSPKVVKMVKNLKDFEYILTDTEFEAFMLECKLIKELKPMYNRQMKNPKSYSYIRIDTSKKYPSIDISNEFNKDDDSLHFGPYTSKNIIERALQGIKEHYKLMCINNLQKSVSCLNYSLGLCIGPCLNEASKEQYLVILKKIIKLLNCSDKGIIFEMENKMNTLAENLNFENAAKYRDYISALNYIVDKNEIVEFIKENRNIALLEYLNKDNLKFFLINRNKILFNKTFNIKHLGFQQLKFILKTNILSYFNNDSLENSIRIGKYEIDESQIIYTYLKSKYNNCKYIIVSEKLLNDVNDIDLDKELNKLLSI